MSQSFIIKIILILFLLITSGCEVTSEQMSLKEIAIKNIIDYTQKKTKAPTIEVYKTAGIKGINLLNINKINKRIKQLPKEDIDTLKELLVIIESEGISQLFDRVPPKIIIHGDNPLTIEQFSIYQKECATVTDNIDENLKVYILGDVNTSKLGTYKIKYSAVDGANNLTEKFRIINVVEKVIHKIELLASPERIRIGKKIELKIKIANSQNERIEFEETKDVVFNQIFCITNIQGFCSIFASSDIKNSYETHIKIPSQPDTLQSIKYEFINDTINDNNNTRNLIEITNNNTIADNNSTIEISVQVVDTSISEDTQNKIFLSNQKITFLLPKELTSIPQNSCVTNTLGICSIHVKTKKSGAYNIRITREANNILLGNILINFKTGTINLEHSKITLFNNHAIADKIENILFKLSLKDIFDNPILSEEIEFSTDKKVTLDKNRCTTNTEGECNLTALTTNAGNYLLAILLTRNQKYFPETPFSFRAESPDNKLSLIKVIKNNALADNQDYNEVEAFIKDKNGNTIEGSTITFSSTKNLFLDTKTCTTTDTGKCHITLKSLKDGQFTIQSKIQPNLSLNPVKLTFQALKIDTTQSYLEVIRNNSIANNQDPNYFKMHLFNTISNPVKDTKLIFIASGFAPQSCITDTNGECLISFVSPTAKTTSLLVRLEDGTIITSSSLSFIAGLFDLNSTRDPIEVTNNNTIADNNSTIEFSVQLVDTSITKDAKKIRKSTQNKTFLSNQKVTFLLPKELTAIPQNSCVTNTLGICSIRVKTKKSGAYNISITQERGKILLGKILINFKAGVINLEHSKIMLFNNPAVPNAIEKIFFKLSLKDLFDNPLVLEEVEFSTDKQVTLDKNRCTTNTEGECNLTALTTNAGNYLLAILLTRNQKYFPETPFSFRAESPDNKLSLIKVIKNNALADNQDYNEIEAFIKDKNGNTIEGSTITFSSTQNLFLDIKTCTTTDTGKCHITLKSLKDGQLTIQSKIQPNLSLNPVKLTFQALKIDTTQSYLEVIRNNSIANNQDPNYFKMHLFNTISNPVKNAKLIFSASGFNSQNCITDINGECLISFISPIAKTTPLLVKLEDEALITISSLSFTTGVINLEHSKIILFNNHAIADGVEKIIFKLSLKDLFDNPLILEEVEFSTDKKIILDKNRCKMDLNGECNLTASTRNAGNYLLTTLLTHNQKYFLETPFSFQAGPPDNSLSFIKIITNNALADNQDYNEIEAFIKDKNDNIIQESTISFSSTPNLFFDTKTCTTTDTGKCRITLKSLKDGQFTIKSKIQPNLALNLVELTFQALEIDTAQSYLEIVHNNSIANNQDKNYFRMHLFNTISNPVKDTKLIFSASGFTPQNCITDTNGECLISFVSSTAKTTPLLVKLEDETLITSSSLSFIAGPLNISQSTFIVNPDNAVEDNKSIDILTSTLKDSFNNSIIEKELFFYPTIVDNHQLTLNETNCTTNTHGKCSIEGKSAANLFAGSNGGASLDTNTTYIIYIKDREHTLLASKEIHFQKGYAITIETYSMPPNTNITLQLNNQEELIVFNGADKTTFDTLLANGSEYNVTIIKESPNNSNCTFIDPPPDGIIDNSDIFLSPYCGIL